MRTRIAALAVVALVAASEAAAQPFGGAPQPTTVASSFRAVAQLEDRRLLSWEASERYAERVGTSLAERPRVLERDGTRFFAREAGQRGSVDRRLFAAKPDAFSLVEHHVRYRDFVLARARAGKRALTPVTLGGAPAWRASLALRANDCAGLRRGQATLWLARDTLLPLRLRERRGLIAWTFRWAYSDVNAPLPASDFATPEVGARPFRDDQRFRRTSPAEAAAHLSYQPRLPTVLPPGFSLAVSGWAPRSNVTGAEASMPARPELFGAVYRRGLERIDVTQRLAGRRGWVADPFGGECLFEYVERATVHGARGRYGIGPEITPHLFWRRGRVLYTVSGPFPKRDLLAIARSLAPVP